ncbi:hypothetical protein [Terricaulis sp.]|uniref:DUF2541 family protein n=1 Tax=Terricaulis sp. TaxID=2768686 RepID=UPI00378325FA
MKFKVLALSAVLAFSAIAPAYAFDLVGTRTVRDRTDHDVISLPGHRQFSRIRLCVYRNPVHFYDLDVRYQNGGHEDVSVRSRINPGECTRWIDLRGDDRDITTIGMTYEETSFRRRTATVRVYAE